MNIKDSIEYKAIQEFYGDGEAKRSHIPFMNHIDEGLAILERINASDRAKRAFCIHPIAQSYNDVSGCSAISANLITKTITSFHTADSWTVSIENYN